MYSSQFIQSIKNLIITSGISLPWEEFEKKELWQYVISCFIEHDNAIESIISLGYTPLNYTIANICFREIDSNNLWNGIPRSDIYIPIGGINFADYKQGVLVIEFLLPNLPESNELSETRYLKIEFQ